MIETKFKQGELCAIPTDWAEGRFCDFLQTFSSGATPYRGNPRNYIGSIPWISSGELNYNVITDTLEHISENAQKQTNLKLHKPGTFLMAITGLEAAGTRGKCAFVGVPATTNQSCMAINGTDKMDTSYLYWFYRFWSETLAFKFCQGTKQQSYTAAIVKSLPIYTPDNIVEQQRIASALTSVDNLLSSLDKLIAKKRDIKQGAMQQLLTGKTRLKGFTEPWVDKTLGEVCDILDSRRAPLNDSQREAGNYPYCGANGIVDYINKYEFDEPLILIAEDGGNFEQYRTKPIAYVMTGKYWVNNHAHVLKSRKEYDQNFIFYSLAHKDITHLISGGTRSKLTLQQLKIIGIALPKTLSEQRHISNILLTIDTEIAALEAKRKKYEAVKQGMMQQLLTGKIRLL
jgi:type I restriction enzyme S subunit